MCACFPASRIFVLHFFSSKSQDSKTCSGATSYPYARSNPVSGRASQTIEISRKTERRHSVSVTKTLGVSTYIGTTTPDMYARKNGQQYYPSDDDDIVELTQYSPGARSSNAHDGLALHRVESTWRELESEHRYQGPREKRFDV